MSQKPIWYINQLRELARDGYLTAIIRLASHYTSGDMVPQNGLHACLSPMVVRIDSPIWSELSRFGFPYPPYEYGYRMRQKIVDFDRAKSLGLCDETYFDDKDDVEPVLWRVDRDEVMWHLENQIRGWAFWDHGVLRHLKK